jgi:hypothetical protein
VRIEFTARSSFLPAINEAFDAAGECPGAENTVIVQLSRQGYPGTIQVDITEDASDSFDSDWDGTDLTRFPARIRAAATVLRNRRCFGRFVIRHEQGHLTINRMRST